MEFTILEEAVLYSALEKYCVYCENCLKNPYNAAQFTFIRGDLDLSKALMKKIKEDYVFKGGQPEQL